MRRGSYALTAAATAALLATIGWAYQTPNFWETIPALPCIVVTASLAASATDSWSRRIGPALIAGVVAGAMTFISSLLVTLGRWEG